MRLCSRKAILLGLLLALLIAHKPVTAQDDVQPIAKAILFYSPTCPHCREVIDHVLPPLQDAYRGQLAIQLFNLTDPSGYQVYAALHERFPELPGGVPQLYIDQYVLVGSVEVRDNLPSLIDACLAKGGCDWPFTVEAPTSSPAPQPTPAAEPLYLAYCFDPTCLECDQVTLDLNYLQTQYPNLVIRRFNVWDDAATIEAMCESYGVPPQDRLRVPAVFVGEYYLGQEEITVSRLTALIENANATGNSPPWEGLDTAAVESATDSIAERFGNFSVLAVAAAGLLDGVNPCAFTTIIFFISYLALVGRSKRDIIFVGASFTLAVFLTYLTMGLGLSTVVEQIGSIATISRVIYGGTTLVCLTLAALSLWDYVKIRRGQISDIALQLPSALKKRIHETIRTHTRMRGYIAAAFVAGVLVSVFELACTGQVYLPTIVFMTSVEELRLSALAYLILYNALFVLPLIVVFAVTYFGVSSQRLTLVFKANAGAVKLLTAFLFGVLGFWLAYLLVT
jgi:cytochrome c biogenesis protein CcdA